MMTYEEEIEDVFKTALSKGRNSVSIDTLVMMTDIPKQTLHSKLNNMQKYGLVKPTLPSKKPVYWKFRKG